MREGAHREVQGISRRRFLQTGAGALAGLAAARSSRAAAPGEGTERKAGPPNILLLVDGQHRADCLAAGGNSAIRTPNLDRLAAEGARFPLAYSSVPSPLAGRMALLTGQSPWGHGMLGSTTIPEDMPIECPGLLGASGYYALGAGALGFMPPRLPHGYNKTILDPDDYLEWFMTREPDTDPSVTARGPTGRITWPWPFDEKHHVTYWTADQVVDFLDKREDEAPFFAGVFFSYPRMPFAVPKRFLNMYEEVDLPKARVGEWAEERYGKFTQCSPLEATRCNAGEEAVREVRLGVYASISFLDEQIGRILDTLKKHDLYENTLVLFTSTSGEMAGDHHMWRTSYPYEASARIPMILRWPQSLLKAAKRGRVLSQPVELRDVAPTFLDAAGAPIPSAVEGRSLLDLVEGKSEGWREYIDLEHCIHVWRRNNWNALTDGKWKYIFEAYDGTQQLFHLEEDPYELRDLAADPKREPEVQKWRKRLIAHLSVRDERWVKDGELVLRKERLMTGPNFPGGERGKFFGQ